MKIKFGHKYYKLQNSVFTTIRGKSWFSQLKIGEIVDISTPDSRFSAEIISLETSFIKSVPLDTLKKDAEFPGFVINSHEDFVNLINSLRSDYMPQANLTSKMTIITLKRCE